MSKEKDERRGNPRDKLTDMLILYMNKFEKMEKSERIIVLSAIKLIKASWVYQNPEEKDKMANLVRDLMGEKS